MSTPSTSQKRSGSQTGSPPPTKRTKAEEKDDKAKEAKLVQAFVDVFVKVAYMGNSRAKGAAVDETSTLSMRRLRELLNDVLGLQLDAKSPLLGRALSGVRKTNTKKDVKRGDTEYRGLELRGRLKKQQVEANAGKLDILREVRTDVSEKDFGRMYASKTNADTKARGPEAEVRQAKFNATFFVKKDAVFPDKTQKDALLVVMENGLAELKKEPKPKIDGRTLRATFLRRVKSLLQPAGEYSVSVDLPGNVYLDQEEDMQVKPGPVGGCTKFYIPLLKEKKVESRVFKADPNERDQELEELMNDNEQPDEQDEPRTQDDPQTQDGPQDDPQTQDDPQDDPQDENNEVAAVLFA